MESGQSFGAPGELGWLLDAEANLSLVAGSLAVILAAYSFRSGVQYNRAQLFLLLRQNFQRIREEMVAQIPDYDDPGFDIPFERLRSDQKAAIFAYWTNAFNEWCATVKIYTTGSGFLWRTFYANAQASALTVRPLREGVAAMMRSNYSFGGMKREYKAVLVRLGRRALSGRADVVLDPETRAEIEAFVKELKTLRVR